MILHTLHVHFWFFFSSSAKSHDTAFHICNNHYWRKDLCLQMQWYISRYGKVISTQHQSSCTFNLTDAHFFFLQNSNKFRKCFKIPSCNSIWINLTYGREKASCLWIYTVEVMTSHKLAHTNFLSTDSCHSHKPGGAFHQAFCQCFSLTNLLSANQMQGFQ